MQAIQTPFSHGLDEEFIEEEFRVIFKTRAVFYCFLTAFYDPALFNYAVHGNKYNHYWRKEAHLLPNAPPDSAAAEESFEDRCAFFIKECQYMIMMRFDPSFEEEIERMATFFWNEIVDELHKIDAAEGLRPLDPPYAATLMGVKGAEPLDNNNSNSNSNNRKDSDLDVDEDDVQEAPSKRRKVESVEEAEGVEGAAPPGLTAAAAQHMAQKLREHPQLQQNYVMALMRILNRWSIQFIHFDKKFREMKYTFMRAVMLIPFLLTQPDAAVYRIALIYGIITQTRREIVPTDAAGLFVYLRFFTLSQLIIVITDAEQRQKEAAAAEAAAAAAAWQK
jgi:hypothetical protein